MRQNKRVAYIMLVPIVVVVMALVAFPTIYAYYVSMHDARLTGEHGAFIGLKNYTTLFTDTGFQNSLWFSAKFSLFATLFELVAGIGLAVLMNRNFKGKGLATSLILLPMMVAPALFALTFRLMLNEFVGIVPYYLTKFGIRVNPFDPNWVHLTLVIVDAMQWIPFIFIIVYAGLTTIPDELLEAAYVDGASRVQGFVKITLPLLVPTICIAAFLRGIDAFKVYDMIYVLTNGGPGDITTSVSLFIYKKAFLEGNLGEATAASILLTLVFALPLGLTVKYVLKGNGRG